MSLRLTSCLSLLCVCLSACSSSDGGDSSAAAGASANAAAGASANAAAGASANAAAGASANAVAGASSASDAEPAAVAGITAAHNQARAAVTPAASPALPPLTWSPAIAATAQAYAEQCKFSHSMGKYGENLYASAGKDASPADVVSSWVGEAADYDYSANSCTGVCGHYTQVVWRASERLGCGVAKCTTNSPFPGFAEWQIWVCNYDPPGNFNGTRPY